MTETLPARVGTTENIMFNVVERPVFWKDREGKDRETGYKALLRVGQDKQPVQLGMVRQGYKVITNMEIMTAIEEATKGWQTEVQTYADQGGAKSFIDVMFKDVRSAPNGAPINFRTIFWNGFGTTSFGAHIGAINFFCMNGMILGTRETSYKRHTQGLDPGIAHEWITNGLKKFEVQHWSWNKWMNQEVTIQHVDHAIEQMVPHEIQQIRLHALYLDKYVPKYGPNLFSVHETLTDYASHYDLYRLKAVNSNSRNGRSFELLRQAEQIINQMAA